MRISDWSSDVCSSDLVSVLRKRWLAGDLTVRRMQRAVADLADLALTRHPTLALMPRAVELRSNVTPYDAAYIGLAEVLDCPLLTGDASLAPAPGPPCTVLLLPTCAPVRSPSRPRSTRSPC